MISSNESNNNHLKTHTQVTNLEFDPNYDIGSRYLLVEQKLPRPFDKCLFSLTDF